MAMINIFYDSPVNILTDLRDSLEFTIKEGVLKASKKIVVDIDEEKLRQALLHDKKRYSEAYHAGFADGYNEATDAHIDETTKETVNSLVRQLDDMRDQRNKAIEQRDKLKGDIDHLMKIMNDNHILPI